MKFPICTGAIDGGDLVMVCAPCHRSLGGGLAVGETGEFRVEAAAMVAMESRGERPSAVGICAWCDKNELQVKKLLGRGAVALCNECISLCADILDAELGDWR